MLHITCPQCESGLEVDDGFRGGVCRCSQCGALLTVPDEEGPQIVESLGRPDVPEGTPLSPDVYQTASGRKLRLTEDQLSDVPVAKRHRPGVRLATMLGVVCVMGAIALGFGKVVSVMFSAPEPVDISGIYRDVFQIVENPYLMEEPGFMGLPVAGRTVFMIDGSAAMRNYLDMIKPAITHGFQTLDEQEAQVVVWSEDGPVVWPEFPMSGSKIDEVQMLAAMDRIGASGSVSALEGVTRGLMSKPELVILLARQLPDDPTEADAVLARFRDAGTGVTVVLIDAGDKRLEALATETGGAYIELNGGQLQRWYQAFRNAGG